MRGLWYGSGCAGGRLLDVNWPGGCCRRRFRGQYPDVRFRDKIRSLICLTTYRDRSIGGRLDREERLREIRRRRFRLPWLGCPVRSFGVYEIQIRMGLFRRFVLNDGIDIRPIDRLLHAEIDIAGLPVAVVRSRLERPLVARFTRFRRLARASDLVVGVLLSRQTYY